MKNIRTKKIDTQCIHAGTKEDQFGAVLTPIYQVSTFKFQDAEQGARLFKGEEDGYIYTRMRNPTVESFEDCLAVLEGGAKALGCASGMAAVSTLFISLLKTGDHIVCSESVYGATATLLAGIITNLGIETTFVDSSDINAVKNAIKPNTKLIYVETPGNSTLVITDLEETAKLAHSIGAKLAVDNTFMSPIQQRPFDFGADYIVHSLTKFLNGHADVIGGAIVVKDEKDYPIFRKTLNQVGGVIDPFNSFLVQRGMKTLKIRMDRHSENAMKIAKFLENHSKVEWVAFPGLESHPQYKLGKKQMTGPGGMISIELKGGLEAGRVLMNNIQVWSLAVSLGGVESLIQHPASMTHAGMGPEARHQAKITDGLVRLSVGIEDAQDLIDGLEAGLSKI